LKAAKITCDQSFLLIPCQINSPKVLIITNKNNIIPTVLDIKPLSTIQNDKRAIPKIVDGSESAIPNAAIQLRGTFN